MNKQKKPQRHRSQNRWKSQKIIMNKNKNTKSLKRTPYKHLIFGRDTIQAIFDADSLTPEEKKMAYSHIDSSLDAGNDLMSHLRAVKNVIEEWNAIGSTLPCEIDDAHMLSKNMANMTNFGGIKAFSRTKWALTELMECLAEDLAILEAVSLGKRVEEAIVDLSWDTDAGFYYPVSLLELVREIDKPHIQILTFLKERIEQAKYRFQLNQERTFQITFPEW